MAVGRRKGSHDYANGQKQLEKRTNVKHSLLNGTKVNIRVLSEETDDLQ